MRRVTCSYGMESGVVMKTLPEGIALYEVFGRTPHTFVLATDWREAFEACGGANAGNTGVCLVVLVHVSDKAAEILKLP